jgi:hypothetical protein
MLLPIHEIETHDGAKWKVGKAPPGFKEGESSIKAILLVDDAYEVFVFPPAGVENNLGAHFVIQKMFIRQTMGVVHTNVLKQIMEETIEELNEEEPDEPDPDDDDDEVDPDFTPGAPGMPGTDPATLAQAAQAALGAPNGQNGTGS